MKNRSSILIFISLFLLAFSPFEKEAEESVEGRKKYAVGEMAEAENEFSKAAKRLENNAEAYYDLGNALQSQQKYEEALEAYKKSLESGNATQKLRAGIFHNMGNSFAGLGKYQDAEKFYIRSLEEEPSKDTAENLEIVRRIIAQQKEQEQQQNQDQQKNEDQEKEDQEKQDNQDQNQEDQKKQEKEENKENQEQNENPDDERKNEQNQQSAEQNDENNEQNDGENSSGNDDDGETQDEENKSAAAEEQDDEQASNDKAKESSVLKQFKQRKNLQISPFMLKKEQKSDNGQTW